VQQIVQMQDTPWPYMSGRELSNQLSKYDIETKKVRLGKETVQGFKIDQFADAWKRYLPRQTPPPEQGTSGTAGTEELIECELPPETEAWLDAQKEAV